MLVRYLAAAPWVVPCSWSNPSSPPVTLSDACFAIFPLQAGYLGTSVGPRLVPCQISIYCLSLLFRNLLSWTHLSISHHTLTGITPMCRSISYVGHLQKIRTMRGPSGVHFSLYHAVFDSTLQHSRRSRAGIGRRDARFLPGLNKARVDHGFIQRGISLCVGTARLAPDRSAPASSTSEPRLSWRSPSQYTLASFSRTEYATSE